MLEGLDHTEGKRLEELQARAVKKKKAAAA
jgi:hypothetical protein